MLELLWSFFVLPLVLFERLHYDSCKRAKLSISSQIAHLLPRSDFAQELSVKGVLNKNNLRYSLWTRKADPIVTMSSKLMDARKIIFLG